MVPVLDWFWIRTLRTAPIPFPSIEHRTLLFDVRWRINLQREGVARIGRHRDLLVRRGA